MRFLWRELMGWLLVVAGLYVLYVCYRLILDESRLFEGVPLSVVGIIIFRGGIHLLKVAVAAQICSLAKERTRQDAASKPAARPAARKPDGRGPGATTTAARGS